MTAGGLPVAFLESDRLAALPSSAPPIAAEASPPRQRLRLWQLSDSMHCSVIGTCLTTGELRRAMARVLQADVSHISDHDLHAGAVGLCDHQAPASKVLQKTLDQRHETTIRQFARLRSEVAVMGRWAEARRAGDIPGAYWAVLTHPDVGLAGSRQAFGDVHMLSHLVGAANRADIRRLTALEEENAALRTKVERQQSRLQEVVTSRDATISRLSTLAASQVMSATESDCGAALSDLRHLVEDLQTRLAREAGRREQLERRSVEAAEAGKRWERRAREAEAQSALLQQELAALERHQDASNVPYAAMGLPAERILYVGGRLGCVEKMRELLQAMGGELFYHDGGRHDHPSLLPGLISRADRVAFPVDCVSHDAALTVKRVCRQLCKPWLALRSSSLASFLAAVAGPITPDTA